MLALAIGLSFPAWNMFAQLFGELVHKTELVGVNARGAELAAVWQEISVTPGKLLWGAGWGGMFESPAVANIRVNYTHSLLTSMLLKTGVMGLVLTALYIGAIMTGLLRQVRHCPVLALAGPGRL